MSRITAEQAQALLDAATPGPWVSCWDLPVGDPAADVDGLPLIVAGDEDVVGMVWYDGYHIACTEPDAALIAAAPALAEAVVRLERERDALRECVAAWAVWCRAEPRTDAESEALEAALELMPDWVAGGGE